jgi:hypothetical protein
MYNLPYFVTKATLTSGNDLKKFTKPFCCGASEIQKNIFICEISGSRGSEYWEIAR